MKTTVALRVRRSFFSFLLLGIPSLSDDRFCAPVFAQNGNATITGIVQDVSGAVVPGAHVAITNRSTGVVRNTISDSAGEYFLQDLIPGNYILDVTAENMRHYQATDIQLT